MSFPSVVSVLPFFLILRGGSCYRDSCRDLCDMSDYTYPDCEVSGTCDYDYSYHGPEGPSHWSEMYPDCGDPFQSPIDIDTCHAEPAPCHYLKVTSSRDEAGPNGRDDPVAMFNYSITNNGHTAIIRLILNKCEEPPLLEAREELPRNLFYMLLRWGPNSSVGSEHTIDGRRSFLELQAVFNIFPIDKDNVAQPPLVLSVFYENSTEDNRWLAAFAPTLSLVEEAGSSAVSATPVNLYDMIPHRPRNYGFYAGSTSWPPCQYPNFVNWFVVYKTLSASVRQVEPFRKLKDKIGQPISANYRPLQPADETYIRKKAQCTNCVECASCDPEW